MSSHPVFIVQFNARQKVERFRAGLGDTSKVVALGIDDGTFWTVAGIDALYLSLSRAERWGARPLPPYRVALFPTTDADQATGLPRHILAGLVLKEADPNTAAFGLPILAKSILRVVNEHNAAAPAPIRTIGVFEFELRFPEVKLEDIGRLFRDAIENVGA